MTEKIRSRQTLIPQGDLQIAAYLAEPILAEPIAPQPTAAVIVIQEIFGVNAHLRSVVDRVAGLGYVAIAPALFQRTAPGFEVGYTLEETVLGREHKAVTTAAQLLSDLQATIDYLRTLPTVTGKIGAIGFCFGGHVAYLAATLPDVTATASFYGAGIANSTPGGGLPTLTRTSDIAGTLYTFFGTQDPLIPVEQIDQIEAELDRQPAAHRLFRYPVGHGFFCDARSDYNPAAAADAWVHIQQLFQDHLS
jgi:carboxymethylenebutenolidase